MQQRSESNPGWDVFVDNECVLQLLSAAISLDHETEYELAELAREAGVTMKALYLGDDVDRLVELSVFDRAESDDGSTVYTVNSDSDVLAAAEQLEAALTAQQR